MALTKEQQKFIKLAKKREDLYEISKKLGDAIEEAMNDIGVGEMFQDPETKVVYKLVTPEGSFVSYKKIDYKRTNKIGENRGSSALAKKDATEAGFEL